MGNRAACLLAVVLLLACGEELEPVISKVSPLNGATHVDVVLEPTVEAAGGSAVDPYERKIVLFDVTGGGRKTVPGTVAVEGTTITYEPQGALQDGHEYLLELLSGSITGSEDSDEVDGSESPHEPLSWPYRLGFRTGSRPRVRAAYLQSGPSILVRFSQPMNAIITGNQIQVVDLGGKPLSLGTPIWVDTQSVRVDVEEDLDPVGLYTLKVGREATAEDGILLDGDNDGKAAEPDDDFSVQFTGSQQVILSRLP
jgi:hypothetical protein